jgi:hypothetical protein
MWVCISIFDCLLYAVTHGLIRAGVTLGKGFFGG